MPEGGTRPGWRVDLAFPVSERRTDDRPKPVSQAYATQLKHGVLADVCYCVMTSPASGLEVSERYDGWRLAIRKAPTGWAANFFNAFHIPVFPISLMRTIRGSVLHP